MQESSLIFTIAVSLTSAFIFGLIAFKLRLSPIVGYLIAGIVISPHTPGLVANSSLAAELSDLGIILLMFGVGLHFSMMELLGSWRIALFGVIPQIILSTVAGTVLGTYWGWPWGACVLFGLGLSVASTIVLISELEKQSLLQNIEGKVSISWLLAQDLVVVFILVLLPALAPALREPSFDWHRLQLVLPSFFYAAARATIFIASMLFIGRRFFPWLLLKVADTGSRELFTLFVIGVPIGISLLAAQMFSVSLALGAFLAGIVLNESDLSHRAAAKALPLQDAFAVLFFVSTGMSFNPQILSAHWLEVICGVLFVIVINPLAAWLLLAVSGRYSASLASAVAAGLAQIGEFSIVLAVLGLKLAVLPQNVYNIILAIALISICLHSHTFRLVRFLGTLAHKSGLLRFIRANDELTTLAPTQLVQLEGHAILIGYGRVGAQVGKTLEAESIPYVVVEENRDIIDSLKHKGILCIYGSGDTEGVLKSAGIEHCRLLVVTSPDPIATRLICDDANALNPSASIIVRTHSEEEKKYLEKRQGVSLAVFGENELAKTVSAKIIESFGHLARADRN